MIDDLKKLRPSEPRVTITHIALVDNPPDPNCKIVSRSVCMVTENIDGSIKTIRPVRRLRGQSVIARVLHAPSYYVTLRKVVVFRRSALRHTIRYVMGK
jgi:hypothetical protein